MNRIEAAGGKQRLIALDRLPEQTAYRRRPSPEATAVYSPRRAASRLRPGLLTALMLMAGVSCAPMPELPPLGSLPTAEDYMLRARCMRQQINRMVADPTKNASRSVDDMAAYAVGRCSQGLWAKIARSTRDLNQGVDDRMFDELSARRNAMAEVIEARERLHSPSP